MLTGLGPRQHAGATAGRLKPLVDALTEPELEQRVPSADAALELLRRLGVPPGAPWQDDPEPPEVFDQLGEVGVPPERPGAPSYVGPQRSHSAAPAASNGSAVPGPQRSTPSGAVDTDAGQPAAALVSRGQATIVLAIVCFLAAIGLSATALYLIVS